MKRLAALALLLCLVAPLAAASQDWPQASRAVQAEADTVREQAALGRQEMEKRARSLRQEAEQLRADVAEKEKLLAERKARFEILRQEEQKARQELAEQEKDLGLIESAGLNAARDAEQLFLRSLGSGMFPHRLAACRAMLDGEGLPSFDQIKNLAEALLEQMADSGSLEKKQSVLLGLSGDQVRADVLRIGENVAYYMHEGRIGGLTLLEGGLLSASPAPLPDEAEDALAAAFADSLDRTHAGRLPLDLSGGLWFDVAPEKNGFWEHVLSGGFLVWPILAVGLAGLLIGLERLLVLSRCRMASASMLDRLEALLGQGDRSQCRTLCTAAADSPACRVLGAGLDHAGASRDVLENVFHDAILKEVPRLERFLPTLAVLGAVAPLLGLLGTVTGMINTFGMMTLFGNSDPKLMSGGISEALVTTQLGLCVAIPILLLHHFLERRVDGIVADMEEKSVAFSVTLLRNGTDA
ncbi:MAG: MotA/TolQ/ExbB proton channel family protein [Desulfovibrionaceae bacterium]